MPFLILMNDFKILPVFSEFRLEIKLLPVFDSAARFVKSDAGSTGAAPRRTSDAALPAVCLYTRGRRAALDPWSAAVWASLFPKQLCPKPVRATLARSDQFPGLTATADRAHDGREQTARPPGASLARFRVSGSGCLFLNLATG